MARRPPPSGKSCVARGRRASRRSSRAFPAGRSATIARRHPAAPASAEVCKILREGVESELRCLNNALITITKSRLRPHKFARHLEDARLRGYRGRSCLTGRAGTPYSRGPRERFQAKWAPVCRPGSATIEKSSGRVAQRESTPFTREGSQVQSLSRPPFFAGGTAQGQPFVCAPSPANPARSSCSRSHLRHLHGIPQA